MNPLVQMADGNPGALNVLHTLWMADDFISLVALRDLGFRGPDIWVAYKDFAGCDLEKLRKALRERDPAMVAAVESER